MSDCQDFRVSVVSMCQAELENVTDTADAGVYFQAEHELFLSRNVGTQHMITKI